jgi:hypothetical protein
MCHCERNRSTSANSAVYIFHKKIQRVPGSKSFESHKIHDLADLASVEILDGVVRSVTSDLHGMRLTGPTLLVRWIPMPVPHAR